MQGTGPYPSPVSFQVIPFITRNPLTAVPLPRSMTPIRSFVTALRFLRGEGSPDPRGSQGSGGGGNDDAWLTSGPARRGARGMGGACPCPGNRLHLRQGHRSVRRRAAGRDVMVSGPSLQQPLVVVTSENGTYQF